MYIEDKKTKSVYELYSRTCLSICIQCKDVDGNAIMLFKSKTSLMASVSIFYLCFFWPSNHIDAFRLYVRELLCTMNDDVLFGPNLKVLLLQLVTLLVVIPTSPIIVEVNRGVTVTILR